MLRIAGGTLAVAGFGLSGLGCRAGSQLDKPCVPSADSKSPAPASDGSETPAHEGEVDDIDHPGPPGAEGPIESAHSGGQAPLAGSAGPGALLDLDRWARKHGGRARGRAVNLRTGEVLFELESDVPVNPASTQKLLTSGAALSLLGPSYRFKTEAWVEPGVPSELKSIELVGGGAPDLTVSDLQSWVSELVQEGVRRVDVVRVNQSLFSGNVWPPAYEEQPGEWAAFRAPISALSLEKNTVTLHVTPSEQGKAGYVWLSPPGLSLASGQVETGAPKSGDRVVWDLTASPELPGLTSRLSGSLGVDAGPRTYERRVEDPRLLAGLAFRELLRAHKIETGKQVEFTQRPIRGAKLWRVVRSAPLATLVRQLGKDSDNFTAEMLTVALSAVDREGEPGRPWSTERGLRVLRGWLAKLGLHAEAATLRNGSGLFGANKVSCELIVGVLGEMVQGSSVVPEYLSQLSIGGVDGTLRGRFEREKWAQRVRAKTGTLKDTDALAGYVYPVDAGLPVAFSIVVSGVVGQHAEARKRIDRIVRALAEKSTPSAPSPAQAN